ncbi:ATP-binding protein [Pseudoxanthomonas japonensis]|uniref:ATP-binding protein n=1 Tax=Pseudoxanthomonas japonensis TaxID=69284 RepID=UPI0037491A80
MTDLDFIAECPEHGPYTGVRGWTGSPATYCKDCHNWARTLEEIHRLDTHYYQWWLQRAGIPHRYRSATQDSIKPLSASAKQLRLAVEGYSSAILEQVGEGKGLTLLGPPGTGKTLALIAITNKACRCFDRVVYAVWPDVLASVKDSYGRKGGKRGEDILAPLYDAPLLALDELAMGMSSEFDHGELFKLIDYRYRNTLTTLVASNATEQTFGKSVGDRVADRLDETNARLSLIGESLRSHPLPAGNPAFPEVPRTITTKQHERGQWKEKVYEPPYPVF